MSSVLAVAAGLSDLDIIQLAQSIGPDDGLPSGSEFCQPVPSPAPVPSPITGNAATVSAHIRSSTATTNPITLTDTYGTPW